MISERSTDENKSTFDLFTFFKTSGKYVFINFATKSVGLISLPFLANYLDPDEYGVLNLFNTLIQILIVVGTFNLQSSIIRYYYDETSDFKAYLSTIFFLIFALAGCVSLSLYCFSRDIAFYLDIPEAIIQLSVPMFIGVFLYKFIVEFFVAQQKSNQLLAWSLVYEYGKLGLMLLAFYFIQASYLSKILSDLAMTIFFAGGALFLLRKQISLVFDKKYISYALAYSLPLIPYTLSSIILGHSDKLIINSLEGTTSTGLYSFAYELGMLLSVFNQAIHNASRPKFFGLMNRGAFGELRTQAQYIIRIIVFGALGLLYWIEYFAKFISDESFHDGVDIILIIVMGYVFMGFFQLFGRMLFYSKDTVKLSLITFFSGGVNIVMNLMLIPIYGYKVSAVTTLISFALMFLLSWYACYKTFDLSWFPSKELVVNTLLFIAFLAAGLGVAAYIDSVLLEIVVKFFLFLCFGAVLFPDEILKIRKILTK